MLDNIEEIKDWIKNFTNLSNNEFEIIKENDSFIINTFVEIKIKYDENIGIPIKFNTIHGNFFVDFKDPLSYKKIIDLSFLPKNIHGNLNMPGAPLTQESFKNWNTKYIKSYVNFCGINTKISNFDFLENTNFEKVYIRLANTPFKDNIIPKIYKDILSVYGYTLTKEELMKTIDNKEIVLDYFDFTSLEINKDKSCI